MIRRRCTVLRSIISPTSWVSDCCAATGLSDIFVYFGLRFGFLPVLMTVIVVMRYFYIPTCQPFYSTLEQDTYVDLELEGLNRYPSPTIHSAAAADFAARRSASFSLTTGGCARSVVDGELRPRWNGFIGYKSEVRSIHLNNGLRCSYHHQLPLRAPCLPPSWCST